MLQNIERLNMRASLIEKIGALPDDRIAEIEDFVDFVHRREEVRALRRAFTSASESALAKVWEAGSRSFMRQR